MPLQGKACFIGVDVGTGSARAGVFRADGALLASARSDITIWRETGDIVEQSSENIWRAVSASVREAVAASGAAAGDIAGIGFDATCSLVAIAKGGAPVSVSPSGEAERNIIVWMDHRATGEAAEINAGQHDVLRYVGGVISPEMQTPKLLWLKRNLPESFGKAAHFFDLPDYLSWRATGSLARSTCTVTCKWTYLAHEGRWDAAYFRAIGLDELADEGFARIGTEIVEPGAPVGRGLSEAAARDLGLVPGIAVASSLIDAHAGGLGTLGARIEGVDPDPAARLAYIFGTSACSMVSTAEPSFVPGVWGPYHSAMIPGLWLNEGGQSAAGAALDHLVTLHAAATEHAALAGEAGQSLVEWLEAQATALAEATGGGIDLAGGIHVVPEFLGNRSPFADPDARAVVAGLGLDRDRESHVALYIAGVAGIGYGLRQLIERLPEKGRAISVIVASGGAARSRLVCQLLADATGVPVAVPVRPEPVLLGAAMLGAVASGHYRSMGDAMAAMSGACRMFRPEGGAVAHAHSRRFAAFETLQSAARAIREAG